MIYAGQFGRPYGSGGVRTVDAGRPSPLAPTRFKEDPRVLATDGGVRRAIPRVQPTPAAAAVDAGRGSPAARPAPAAPARRGDSARGTRPSGAARERPERTSGARASPPGIRPPGGRGVAHAADPREPTGRATAFAGQGSTCPRAGELERPIRPRAPVGWRRRAGDSTGAEAGHPLNSSHQEGRDRRGPRARRLAVNRMSGMRHDDGLGLSECGGHPRSDLRELDVALPG